MYNNPDKIDHYAVDLYYRLGMKERSQEIARKNKPITIDWEKRTENWNEESVSGFMESFFEE